MSRKRPTKRKPRPAYSPREDAIIKKLFPQGGAAACLEQIRRRDAASVKRRAAILGLKAPIDQRHQGLKRTLSATQEAEALAMRDEGKGFAVIGKHFGVCESTATNAVAHAKCIRNGGTPARRDGSGAIIAQDIARLRKMLEDGQKGCTIILALGISANTVSYHRRRYNAELENKGLPPLPPAGHGQNYSGRKIDPATIRQIEALLISGLGAKRVSDETGVSKSHVGRFRRALIKKLARGGEALTGCSPSGRRLVTLKSIREIKPEQIARLRVHLLNRIPVSRAAKRTGIGASKAYQLRNEFRKELADQGKELPRPKLPGRSRAPRKTPTNIIHKRDIYRFRKLLETKHFDAAKRELLTQPVQTQSQPANSAARPVLTDSRKLSHDEQLQRIRNGAKLIEVKKLRQPEPQYTLGGVSSYGE